MAKTVSFEDYMEGWNKQTVCIYHENRGTPTISL